MINETMPREKRDLDYERQRVKLAGLRLHALNQAQRPLFSNLAKAQSGAQSHKNLPHSQPTLNSTPHNLILRYTEKGEDGRLSFNFSLYPHMRTFTEVKLIMKSSEYMQMR
jgi:hypothetical protein